MDEQVADRPQEGSGNSSKPPSSHIVKPPKKPSSHRWRQGAQKGRPWDENGLVIATAGNGTWQDDIVRV